ncbi:MAG TPA: GGDEF domain-containing protein [Acidobacteriaceae bacterium]|nr:GGDEF domain-containing protein [Acidobacteriaceae bacterium]
MSDRIPLLEAALGLVEEAVIVLDPQGAVAVWNAAATVITGHLAYSVLGCPCPVNLYRLDNPAAQDCFTQSPAGPGGPARLPDIPQPARVSITHRLGHPVPALLRCITLRDDLGHAIGSALLFCSVDDLDCLPHGETHGAAIERSQAELEERLDAAFHQFTASQIPFSLLWISVDQAQSLRRTHGRDASESMLAAIEHTLARQMKPAETLGRWGDNEFLVLTHERTPDSLHEHATRLLGLARTADFRWWGDRVPLTLSIGSSYALPADTLQSLLARAQQAMQSSQYAGGNHVTQGRSH